MVTNYHQGKLGIDIRVDSLSGNGSQSWVRISNGFNIFVKDLTEETRNLGEIVEISEAQGSLSFTNRKLQNILYRKQTNQRRRRNRSRVQTLSHHLQRNRSQVMEASGFIMRFKSQCFRMLRVIPFRKGWLHCIDTELFPETKMDHMNSRDWRRRWTIRIREIDDGSKSVFPNFCT